MSILVQQSEATAAYRRMYFHCVDATDGLTPETGEATGQPQISVNGGAWGNTTNTLAAIGNGRYYVEITAAELGTLGIIEGRYKSANTAEALGMTLQVVPYDPYDSVRMGLTTLPNAAADAAGGLPISDTGGLDLDAKLANTNEITAARMGALTDWIDAGRLDAILDIIATDVVNVDGSAIPTAAAIVNEWESQSQGDPTGFHVNVKEVNGTAQTANDNAADINMLVTRIPAEVAQKAHLVNGTGDITPPTNKGIWDFIGSIVQVIPVIPQALDDPGAAYVGLLLLDTSSGTAIPSANITAGTVTIIRKVPGTSTWATIDDGVALSKENGFVYRLRTFSTANGFPPGTIIGILFAGVSVTLNGRTYAVHSLQSTYYSYMRESTHVAIPGGAAADSIEERISALDDLISASKLPAQVEGMDANVLTASALAADAVNEIRDAIAAHIIDDAIDLEETLKIILAVLAGDIAKSNGTYTHDEQDGTVKVTSVVTTDAVARTIA